MKNKTIESKIHSPSYILNRLCSFKIGSYGMNVEHTDR